MYSEEALFKMLIEFYDRHLGDQYMLTNRIEIRTIAFNLIANTLLYFEHNPDEFDSVSKYCIYEALRAFNCCFYWHLWNNLIDSFDDRSSWDLQKLKSGPHSSYTIEKFSKVLNEIASESKWYYN